MNPGDKVTGTVLWFDKRDGDGIVVDRAGNEYYIDSSVCSGKMVSGKEVTGIVNFVEKTCVSLKDVE